MRDHRDHAFDQPPFPQVTVVLTGSTTVVAGTEQFSARNELDQDIIEINDAFTLLKGQHAITIGTHNELLDLRNLFIRDNFGTYRFNSIELFDQGFAQQYDRSFSATSDPLQSGRVRGQSVGLLHRGSVVRAAPGHADLRIADGRAAVP